MRILVLGSEGQIGKPLVKSLEERGHDVTRWDKVRSRHEDLSCMENQHLIDKAVTNCDAVVFLAFEVGGSKYLKEHDKSYDYINENVAIMFTVFNALKKSPKPFLFASSQMANMHHTNYGFLKDLGERYTKAMGGHICRFWNVFGYEDPKDPKSHVITDFIAMAKDGRINMRTTGNEERQFLYTDDCSEALTHWCENHEKYDTSEYIDITSFEWNSILDVAKIIQKYIPCEINANIDSDTIQRGIKNDPSDYIKNFWSPKLSLEEGIRKLI
jgi:nucleoside-diphosphate-sugar epimerase